MRRPTIRFSLRWLIALVAMVAISLAAERYWRRSVHYRKQAALCAFFESQMKWYATDNRENFEKYFEGATAEYKEKQLQFDLMEIRHFHDLKCIYQRAARYPWESLPPGTPESVKAWDLEPLSATEIEEMVESEEEDP